MVKKLLASAVVLAVLLGVGVLVTTHWQESENKQKSHEVAVTRTAVNEVKASAGAERVKLVEQYNQLRVECEKGLAAYGKLPAYLQKAVPAPKCGAVLQ